MTKVLLDQNHRVVKPKTDKIEVGDRVRVLHSEEMLELNTELHVDRWGNFIQFYDLDDNPIHDAIFPVDDEYYNKLEGRIFTVRTVDSKDGRIDLLEDEEIGWAVTKEMVRKVENIK